MNRTLKTQDETTLSAYHAGDADAPRALVVLQEIFGVNGHIREVCDRFAAEGYEVIAPALFDRIAPNIELGYGPDDIQEGRALRNKLALEASLSDIQAAIDALGDKPIGIIGYCWGGALAWQAACKLDKLKAAVCWYGGGIADARSLTPKVPVQMHFGDQDKSIPMSDVNAIKTAQPDVQIIVYEGADHGFGCDHRGSYDEAAYMLAQERSLAFFDRYLR
ncbi:dienelactone hydrolase family protein [Allopusillimonas ginsengisoli]|uniref:dienelactone hydrolase family protein n=1 Tax=Allopusillimonas ginsengisoli TaxID=453575 RepID=UPI00102004C3|nr:dienelactone hydrolase family protein [Allopusillimonas ginsengisoli]TEA77219.1 dienelactone hydrolase family protein [Allopusillimonas ginsengisoli]